MKKQQKKMSFDMRMAAFERNEQSEKYGLSEGRPQRNLLLLQVVKNANAQHIM